MNAAPTPKSNRASRAIIPDGTITATRPLALAGLVSVALHGSVLAAASWLWAPTVPPEAPPLVAIAMVPESFVRPARQSKRAAPAAKPIAARKRALAALRTLKRRRQTIPKQAVPAAQPKKTRKPSVPSVWGKAPPVPPSPPRFRRQSTQEPRPPVQAKPQTPDPRIEKPVVIKTTPVTAAAAGGPSTTATDSQGGAKQTAKITQAGAKGPPRPVAGLGNPAPAYPWVSRRRGEQGRVILDVAVTADGHAKEVRIKKTSGSARLDQAALAAVKKWRFSPAGSGGRAIAGHIDIPITFQLTR